MSKDKVTKPTEEPTLQRAVLYARVSGDDRKKDDRNLTSQLDMCREYAAGRGYQIVAALHEDDRGACGASFELPQLGAILAMAERSEFDVLVVRELDRLSRNLAKQLIVEETLKRYGVTIEYVLADYADTPEGNLQKHIRATVAEYEREKIRERNIRGRRNVVKSGRIMLHGNRPPYGYRVSEDRKNLVVHEPEAEIIRKIFGWYTGDDETTQECLSLQKIADRLSEMGVPTWADIHGIVPKQRGHAQWAGETISCILHNETYAGKWRYGERNGNIRNPIEYQIELAVPPIVSQSTWEAAQAQALKNRSLSKRNVQYEYLLRCRVECGCGYCVKCYARTNGKGKVYLYYRCNSRNGFPTVHGHCGTPDFRADYVDFVVWDWLKGKLQDPAKLRVEIESYRVERDRINAPILAHLKTCEDLQGKYQADRERAEDMYQSGLIKKDNLVERLSRLDETLGSLKRERAKLMARLQSRGPDDKEIESMIRFVSRRAAGIQKADKDFGERRKLIELFDVRAVLYVEGGRKKVKPSFILSAPDSQEGLDLDNCINQYWIWQKAHLS
ncbi:MAG: recombinase family protein [Thermoflexales bacterium]|nr:recombinase family protein [Thermoflexales bacterium]